MRFHQRMVQDPSIHPSIIYIAYPYLLPNASWDRLQHPHDPLKEKLAQDDISKLAITQWL